MKRAEDVKNVEASLGGKVSPTNRCLGIKLICLLQSDPYVRVMLSNVIMARTEVINNSALSLHMILLLMLTVRNLRLEPRMGSNYLCSCSLTKRGMRRYDKFRIK